MGMVYSTIAIFFWANFATAAVPAKRLRILLDQAPVTLDPRLALDAAGQQLGALLFRGLTRLDSELAVQSDLAARWEAADGGRAWKFTVVPGQVDHEGQAITAEALAACFENYRLGKPTSPVGRDFRGWTGTEARAGTVTFRMQDPDPYLPRNVSLLRYFRVPGETEPCREPSYTKDSKGPLPLIGSGRYRLAHWKQIEDEESDVDLDPVSAADPALTFIYLQDENTRVLRLLRGDADAAFNAFGLPKSRLIPEQYPDRFTLIEREGVKVRYLAFNLKDPVLAKPEVRRAIAMAIPRDEILKYRLFGFGFKADSLLSPRLPESHAVDVPFDPAAAEKLLETAGFPRTRDGIRLALRFKTTSAREGFETALIFRENLRKVGIDLTLDVVEPAVFLASTRKGNFQMFSSSWIGVADGSILHRTLRTGQTNNRWGYSNPEMDALLDRAVSEMNPGRRKDLLVRAQDIAMRDLPYFPLWYWGHALIVRRGISGVRSADLSLSGALAPLLNLR